MLITRLPKIKKTINRQNHVQDSFLSIIIEEKKQSEIRMKVQHSNSCYDKFVKKESNLTQRIIAF